MAHGKKIWMNGKLVPFADAKVHVLTHALHYSTAVFEGIRCYKTPKGPAVFKLSEHVDRLFRFATLYSENTLHEKTGRGDNSKDRKGKRPARYQCKE